MSLLFLTNTVGNTSSGMGHAGSGATASGYSLNDLISGPRSKTWRSTSSASAVRAAYDLAADTTVTHMVIARADLLVTKNGTRVRPIQKSSGAVWSTIAGVDFNPLATSDLMGPRDQDVAFAVSPTQLRGYGIQCDSVSGSQAAHISKLYVASSFSFGQEPELRPPPQWTTLRQETTVNLRTPLRGTFPYEVSDQITLNWFGVTKAKAEAFKALPQILLWPLYLYDDAGTIWDWKLEHVLIDRWTERIGENDQHDFSISFLRLKHYE